MAAIARQPQRATPLFRAYLLGSFTLHWRVASAMAEPAVYTEVAPEQWGKRRQAMRLLAVLLARPGRRAGKDFLIELFWPDTEPEQAAVYLTQTVAKLRKVLRLVEGGESLLIVERAGYRLGVQEQLWVDADAAEALLQQASEQGAERLPLLQEAVTLLQRGPFLEEAEGTWVLGRRGRLQDLRKKSQVRLAQLLAQQGRLDEAETQLSTLLEEDPTDEDVLCSLMELLHLHGMTHQALRVYERSCEVAAREGVEFTEATKNVAAQLATGEQRTYPREALTSSFSLTNGQNSAFSHLFRAMTPAIIEAMRELEGQNMDKSRRLLFQVFSTSVAALLGLSQDTESGMNILQGWDQHALFEQQLAALWDVYHTGGTAQADSKLKMLLTHSEKSLRYSHAAELLCMSYQLQGSLYRDMMKYDDAHVFYQQAFEAAKELDDAELMSAALARRGVTLIQQNKATAAIAYLSEAHGLLRDRTLPCLTGYIFQALSEAYAIAQQEHESKHHIDAAQQVLSDRGKVPERSHCQANTTSVTAQMGVNAVHLHHYAAAIPLIEQGMENYNPTFVRGRARLKAQQAEAYYGLGDIRACCQSATEAWILARAASSNKTFARLRNLQRDLILSPQKKAPEVVDLNWVMTTL